jgi:hypothetical protein
LLFDEHWGRADPYMTLVDYFSSTTELARMRRLVDDDVATRLQQQSRRGLRDRRNLEVRELTARINSQDIGRALTDLANPFDINIDTTAARATRSRLLQQARESGATATRRRRPEPTSTRSRSTPGSPNRSTCCWPRACCRSVSTSPALD